MQRPALILAFLLTLAASVATMLQPEARTWRSRTSEGGLMGLMLGDGRRMFANHFAAKADEYFHAGYYPSIFDQRPEETSEDAHVHDENCGHDQDETPAHVHDENCRHGEDEHTGHVHTAECNHAPTDDHAHVHDDSCSHAHDPAGACAQGCNHSHAGDHSVEACEEKSGGWDTQRDWIARFGRNFRVTEHTHLEGDEQKEMLPWLQISAQLDPKQISTYLLGSYWLRKTGKSVEAEKFIREGLAENPSDCELLTELAEIYLTDRKNIERATSLFEAALLRWDAQEKPKEKPDFILLAKISARLARIEEDAGNVAAAIKYLEIARAGSPQADAIARQIEELKARLPATGTNVNSARP
jgi:hypothetical protein